MAPALKAELRKLFTVRSTYILVVVSLLLVALLAFVIEGYYGESGSAAAERLNGAYSEMVANGAGMAALLLSIIAVLFMAHEYRYNTIMYTLTAHASRSRVLAAKIAIITVFGALLTVCAAGFSILAYKLGVDLRGDTLQPQQLDVWATLGRAAIYGVCYGLLGLLIATLLRNIVGAISVLLGFSIIVEPLLGLALKENAVYLPIAAMDTIVGASYLQTDKLTPNGAIGVAALYLFVGWVVAWLLFLKRDAN